MKSLLIVCSLLLLAGCSTTTYLGNDTSGYKQSDCVTMSIEQAIKAATPYLDESFKIRSENRDWPSEKDSKPEIHVLEDNRYYLVVKDNYPYKYIGDYIKGAVRVDKVTGDVIPPK